MEAEQVEVKGYRCTSCKKIYCFNHLIVGSYVLSEEEAKSRADRCCLCRNCGKHPGLYWGTPDTLCELCVAERRLENAKLMAADADKEVEQSVKHLANIRERRAKEAEPKKAKKTPKAKA